MMRNAAVNLLPARLIATRAKRAMSQSDLADKAGIPATSISHFESGARKPSFETLGRVSDALNVSADYLLGRIDTPPTGRDLTEELFLYPNELTTEDLALAENFLKMLLKRRSAITVC